ncbi:MAG: class I SAM-dependent methyltransferase [Acidobacteriota bacterium]|nr:class I SAM-dependent methyltransferase [Acidobacteriota bacterium]MDE3043644.1 class I SAM-dependent methyltransferase [Acidobacteriota bacterium]
MQSEWLSRALEESRARGFLGPSDLKPHVEHSHGFADVWEKRSSEPPKRFLDLGSGGGLPGLVLLERWSTKGVLLDSMERRTSFLEEALRREGAPSGGLVVTQRAEIAARQTELEGEFDLLTARSFGPPARVVECGSRFLRLGGIFIVSEPPGPEQGSGRWNTDVLTTLGLELGEYARENFGYQVIVKIRETPDEFPRSSTSMKKRPLF